MLGRWEEDGRGTKAARLIRLSVLRRPSWNSLDASRGADARGSIGIGQRGRARGVGATSLGANPEAAIRARRATRRARRCQDAADLAHVGEAELNEAMNQAHEAVDDIGRLEAERDQDHADDERDDDQAQRHRRRRAAEKSVSIGRSCEGPSIRSARNQIGTRRVLAEVHDDFAAAPPRIQARLGRAVVRAEQGAPSRDHSLDARPLADPRLRVRAQ